MTTSHRTTPDLPDKVKKALRLRQRRDIAELDYRRQLRQLHEEFTQRELGKMLNIAQSSVQKTLKVAEKEAPPVEGFSGATPYEICQRYAAGEMLRDKLIDELTRFPYTKSDKTDGYDSLTVDPKGTWAEVSQAIRQGLIDEDVYEIVFNRRHGI
ncbi:hypothetical protein CPHO_01920 [Corynebacterium phocae]|uniref:Uncharacterized protein n=1 Tax=Corynebacterium phocae TaxID=161895 RepID=A0A1L7D146_9CORY|nr:hypothetical protein [Corynebacterium phocae]APT91866.1 hypothetical protein CPHO_01920 [Corynebacterium phocae]KAA8727412.1 hypothetical protein F4V58_01450 [Corynebacterium phocae]